MKALKALPKKKTEGSELAPATGVAVVNLATADYKPAVRRSLIAPSKTNPRKDFNEEKLRELAESIRVHGIKAPLLVRPLPKYELREPDMIEAQWRIMKEEPKEPGVWTVVETWPFEGPARMFFEDLSKCEFELVAGERRWRAAELAGLQSVPVLVENLTDEQVVEIQIIENDQRDDIGAFDRANGYKHMRDHFGYTVEQIAERVGKKRSTVFNALQLLKLFPVVQEAIASGKLIPTIGNLIARVPTQKLQEEALEKILTGGGYNHSPEEGEPSRWPMSHRDAKRFIQAEYTFDLGTAMFSQEDAELVPVVMTHSLEPSDQQERVCGGACTDCPFRSGTDPERFPEIKSPNVCTMPDCFNQKVEAHKLRQLDEYAKQGKKVLTIAESSELFGYGGSLVYRAPYVEAADICHDDEKGRSFDALLKAKMPEPVITVDPQGKVRTLFPKEAVADALEKKGIEVHSLRPQQRVEDTPEEIAAREFEKKVETEVEKRTVARVIEIVEKKADTAKMQLEVYRFALPRLMDLYESPGVEVLQRRGLVDAEEDNLLERSRVEYAKFTAKMNAAQLLGLVLELSVTCGGVSDADMKALCEWFKISQADIEKQVRKDLAPKPEPEPEEEELPIEGAGPKTKMTAAARAKIAAAARARWAKVKSKGGK